eukprot:CAMPEP_0171423362 /NCGR_PEP_ID=MMETSP0881-20121228/1942_1 /TAXON_ID=67004 /ORGANISM="Thalassiosira weissflogii, Strain CCMP1336" /LENGTH=690 /DNA_ID=CAMNT_0011942255 /DNA_START=26 /DNA_END=2098 /DNA_ORIENTATION=+
MARDNFQHLFRRDASNTTNTTPAKPKQPTSLQTNYTADAPSETSSNNSLTNNTIAAASAVVHAKDANNDENYFKGETTIDFTSEVGGPIKNNDFGYDSSSMTRAFGETEDASSGELIVGFGAQTRATQEPQTSQKRLPDSSATAAKTESLHSPTVATMPASTQPTAEATTSNRTRPGTESIQYLSSRLKNIGSMGSNLLSQPWRDIQLAEKLNAMNSENEEMEAERMRRQLEDRDRSSSSGIGSVGSVDIFARRSSAGDNHTINNTNGQSEIHGNNECSKISIRDENDEQEELELKRLKDEADEACERIGHIHDSLSKFVEQKPHGTYEDFLEFLLLEDSNKQTSQDVRDYDYNPFMFENFYDENSVYRKLWNDNLTMGLPNDASTVEGRHFVPPIPVPNSVEAEVSDVNAKRSNNLDPWDSFDFHGGQIISNTAHSNYGAAQIQQEQHPFSFRDHLRGRTFSDGERIKKFTSQVGSAVNALSNVSSYALKPLRDLQLAEKLNAMNLDMEDEETRKEIEQYDRMEAEKRDYEEAMMLKKEAEESCLNATREHLLEFIRKRPDAKYHEWIEDFHPENAHDGALLEGLGKTIDHRFYVEESDHRKLWNEHLLTFVDTTTSEGRMYVPARAKQWDDNGNMVTATDLLSGSFANADCTVDDVGRSNANSAEDGRYTEDGEKAYGLNHSDLIAFD